MTQARSMKIARPAHSHVAQSRTPVRDCPACALIRPAVMHRYSNLRWDSIEDLTREFGPVPTPIRSSTNPGKEPS